MQQEGRAGEHYYYLGAKQAYTHFSHRMGNTLSMEAKSCDLPVRLVRDLPKGLISLLHPLCTLYMPILMGGKGEVTPMRLAYPSCASFNPILGGISL